MATGRSTQLTKQVGEYLVAAEICRRGFVAATFSGNVPHYDIIASSESGKHLAVQVKAIARDAWQFDARKFMNIQLDGEKQIIGDPVPTPYPDLVCVFLKLETYGEDEFFIFMWDDLQRIAIQSHRRYLDKHGQIRPKKFDSFHLSLSPSDFAAYKDRWAVLTDRLV